MLILSPDTKICRNMARVTIGPESRGLRAARIKNTSVVNGTLGVESECKGYFFTRCLLHMTKAHRCSLQDRASEGGEQMVLLEDRWKAVIHGCPEEMDM